MISPLEWTLAWSLAACLLVIHGLYRRLGIWQKANKGWQENYNRACKERDDSLRNAIVERGNRNKTDGERSKKYAEHVEDLEDRLANALARLERIGKLAVLDQPKSLKDVCEASMPSAARSLSEQIAIRTNGPPYNATRMKAEDWIGHRPSLNADECGVPRDKT